MSSDPVTFGKAIADETRQRIMKLLCCREHCVSDLVAELGDVTQPTVSHQWKRRLRRHRMGLNLEP